MECQEISALLGAFVDDELPIELIARVNAHLGACLPCQDARNSLMVVRSRMQSYKAELEPPDGFLERLRQNVELKMGASSAISASPTSSATNRNFKVLYLVLPLAVAAGFGLFFVAKTDLKNFDQLAQAQVLTAPELYSYEAEIRKSGKRPTEYPPELAVRLTGSAPAAPRFDGWQLKRTSVVSVNAAKAIKYSYEQIDNGRPRSMECYQFPGGIFDASALSHHVIDGRSICCGTKGVVSLVYWCQTNKDFVLASELSREDLLSIALDS